MFYLSSRKSQRKGFFVNIVAGNQPVIKCGGRGRFVTFNEWWEQKKIIIAELKFAWKCGIFLTCGQLAVAKISWRWTIISLLVFKVAWRSMINVFSASSPLISIKTKQFINGPATLIALALAFTAVSCVLPSHRPLTEFKVELIDSS